jgi:hypothetical protein
MRQHALCNESQWGGANKDATAVVTKMLLLPNVGYVTKSCCGTCDHGKVNARVKYRRQLNIGLCSWLHLFIFLCMQLILTIVIAWGFRNEQ